MTELGPVAWPPAPLRTERLVTEVERFEEYGAEQWVRRLVPGHADRLSRARQRRGSTRPPIGRRHRRGA